VRSVNAGFSFATNWKAMFVCVRAESRADVALLNQIIGKV
jgi:hypothetical protein